MFYIPGSHSFSSAKFKEFSLDFKEDFHMNCKLFKTFMTPLHPAFVRGPESARGALPRAGHLIGHPMRASPELGTEVLSVGAPDQTNPMPTQKYFLIKCAKSCILGDFFTAGNVITRRG